MFFFLDLTTEQLHIRAWSQELAMILNIDFFVYHHKK